MRCVPHLRSNSGQSLIEVALITPLLLTMMLGVIDMGRYFYLGILVGNAARAGAAYGAVAPGDTAGIEAAACNDFEGNSTCSGIPLTVTESQSCGCDNGGTIGSYYGGSCDAVPNKLPTDPIPSCTSGGGHWAAMINVEAKGTFSALIGWPGIPSSITIDRTATMRVND